MAKFIFALVVFVSAIGAGWFGWDHYTSSEEIELATPNNVGELIVEDPEIRRLEAQVRLLRAANESALKTLEKREADIVTMREALWQLTKAVNFASEEVTERNETLVSNTMNQVWEGRKEE